jgi:hypothetical protein
VDAGPDRDALLIWTSAVLIAAPQLRPLLTMPSRRPFALKNICLITLTKKTMTTVNNSIERIVPSQDSQCAGV